MMMMMINALQKKLFINLFSHQKVIMSITTDGDKNVMITWT